MRGGIPAPFDQPGPALSVSERAPTRAVRRLYAPRMPHPGRWRRLRRLGVAVAGLAACVPGPGTCRMPAVEGRVVDAQTGAPIAAAIVVERWQGAGVAGGPQPTRQARFAVSDAAGRFAFAAACAPSPRMWAERVYGPSYAFVHPVYGLVRPEAARDAAGALTLSGSLDDARARRVDLETLCTTVPREEWERELALRACPPPAERPSAQTR